MAEMKRREFIEMAGPAALGLAASLGLARVTTAQPAETKEKTGASKRVKIGQIGTAHAHAAGKTSTLRKLKEEYEVVGVVEPDPERRRVAEDQPAYRGLTWMTEEQLLSTTGLQAVAVETAVGDLVPTAARCVAAHVDSGAAVDGQRLTLHQVA